MALIDTLRKLFTRNIIVTHSGGVLKVFDVSKAQSTGAKTAKGNYHKWYGSGFSSGYSQNTTAYDVEANRLRMYTDYELMDSDAIIASALDIYADSATVKDANGQLLTIHTQNVKIKKILYNLFYDVLNIDFNLWAWTRELCKFGDYFLYLQIKEQYGIVNVIPIHPSLITREENYDPERTGEFRFKYGGMDQTALPSDTIEQYEMAHFRMLSDSKFQPYGRCLCADSYIEMESGVKQIHEIVVGDKVWTYNITDSKYELAGVLNTCASGTKDILKVRTRHNELRCSIDHNILVYNESTTEYEYKEANKLNIGDCIVLGDGSYISSESVIIDKTLDGFNKNGWKNNIDLVPDEVNGDFARLYGFMLGDGWINEHTVTFSRGVYSATNLYYESLLQKLSGKNVRLSGKTYAVDVISQATVGSKMLSTVLSNSGFSGKSYVKRIPKWVYTLPFDIQLEFVAGLVDADGSEFVDKWGVRRYTVELANRELVKDLQVLLRRMNIKVGKLCSRNRGRGTIRDWTGIKHVSYYIYFFLDGSKIINREAFRNINTPNIIQRVIAISNDGKDETFDIQVSKNSNFIANGIIVHNSSIEPARKEFKKLSLFEDAMLLQRIMRAPERRIFKVDIGNIAPNEVDGYMQSFISAMKKIPYIDQATGDYNLKFNLQNMLEDYYLPVRGSDSGTTIDTLSGLGSENYTQDVEYSKSKLLAALKIPKAWLGYDESIDGKANTAGLDIRFASTIERVQKVITAELYRMGIIHLLAQGIPKEQMMDFELVLSNSSTIRKRQEIDVLNEKMNLATNMLESKLFSRQYIYERVFDLSPDEWNGESDQVLEDLKLGFRYKQIEEEGNDPKLSGKSVGTPHDIAAMQMTSAATGAAVKRLFTQDDEDKRTENEGRPPKEGSFGRDKDPAFGRDPNGMKALANQQPNESLALKSGLELYIDSISDAKRRSIDKSSKKQSIDDIDMLNESSLLEDAD